MGIKVEPNYHQYSGTPEEVKAFLSSLEAAVSSSGLFRFPAGLVSALAQAGDGSFVYREPYYYRLNTFSRFPYLEIRLYEGTLPLAFSLGYRDFVSSFKKKVGVEVIGEMTIFNPIPRTKFGGLKEDSELFYFRRIYEANPQIADYFEISSDGYPYAKVRRVLSPWGTLIPDKFRVYPLVGIGLTDIALDVAYKFGSVYLPFAVVTLSSGLLPNHVLSQHSG